MALAGYGDSTTAPVRQYVLNVSASSAPAVEMKIYSGTSLAFNYTALTAGTTYIFRLWAETGACACSTASTQAPAIAVDNATR